MSQQSDSSARFSPRVLLWARAVLLTIALVYAATLANGVLNGGWILDSQRRVIPTDFVSFWSTSLQLQREPAAHVYDWSRHHVAEIETIGSDHKGRYPWLNPPIFLLAVAPLALLPYPAAFLCWLAATIGFYAVTLRSILPSRWTVVGAFAFPATLWTAGVGQNGFLTGALIAGTLGWIERRPYLAGIFLGLLTYKPQFGILFPIVLLASGRWRVIAAASATAVCLALATVMIFGLETWLAFFDALPLAQTAVLSEGRMGFHKLQSPYGVVLWSGGSTTAAWTIQIVSTLAAGAASVWIWRSRASFEVKSACLGAAILLATPYVLIYDLPIVAVPIAFLLRAGISRRFIPTELLLIGLASVLIFAFPFVMAPVGLAAVGLIALAVAQRAKVEQCAVMSSSRPRSAG